MKLLLATTNPGKLREIRAVIDDPSITLLTLADVDGEIPEPIEDGDTFEANATLKARYYARHAGLPTLADDSGLEVDALGGAPGVRSARYAGVDGPREVRDPANNARLMRELEGVPAERRTARFVCAMAFAAPGSGEGLPADFTVRGTLEGRIISPDEAADPAHPERGRGSHGFGYDPLFLVPRLGRTTAELTPDEKNAISHRGQAARAMGRRLRGLLPSTAR